MRSLPISRQVLDALVPRNPYALVWAEGIEVKLAALNSQDREIANSLIAALTTFPPELDLFDILHIGLGMGGSGYTVEVASGTAKRVTVTAKYRQAYKDVTIRDIQTGHRAPGKMKVKAAQKKGV